MTADPSPTRSVRPASSPSTETASWPHASAIHTLSSPSSSASTDSDELLLGREPRPVGEEEPDAHRPRAYGRATGAGLAAPAASDGSGSMPSSCGVPRTSPVKPERGQPRDLALALDPRRVVLGQAADELGDAVADLQREVRRRRAHELADVVDGDVALAAVRDARLRSRVMVPGRSRRG